MLYLLLVRGLAVRLARNADSAPWKSFAYVGMVPDGIDIFFLGRVKM